MNTRRLSCFVLILGLVMSIIPVSARQYKLALPGYHYQFPGDFASHDEFKTEWWYYTGHLAATDGTKYGYELTFFRSAMDVPNPVRKTPWGVDNVYMAHFALTDINGKHFLFQEKLTRPGIGFAGADTNKYNVWNQNWRGWQEGNTQHLDASTPDYAVKLALTSDKPPAIHGENGVSQKASCVGCASHYYSFTRLTTTGTVRLFGRNMKVDGVSWMDHEFGSNQLTADQIGWDWFSIQLDDKVEVMLYVMRLKGGGIDPNSSGTIVLQDGSTQHLRRGQYAVKQLGSWRSPKTRAIYPSGWQVDIPSLDASLRIQPQLVDQELAKGNGTDLTYWEGACEVDGNIKGHAISGQAYVELTGYTKNFNRNI